MIIVVAACSSSPVWADAEDALNFSLGATASWEDNLFRLANSTNTTAALGKPQRSDQIITTNAGVKFDKTYSLQRVQLEAEAIDNRYKTFDYLNYTAFNYRAAWLWHLTPNVSGTLKADRQQVLNNFSDYLDSNNLPIRRRSIQTNESRVFDVDALVGGGWHLLGGALELRSRNSEAFNAVGDYVQTEGNFGTKYVSLSENSITLLERISKGTYQGRVADPVNQLDSGFDQNESEARLNWRLSGKSLIDGRLSYLTRKHDNFSSRNYSGVTGRLVYLWTPTGKLSFNTSVSRNLLSFQQATNSYYVDDTFSIGPVWQFAAKTSLRFNFDYSQRNYYGPITPVAALRKDKVRTFLIAADWKPTRTVTVTGAVQREARSSNFNNPAAVGGDLTYDANSATISTRVVF